jgi:hypothetical protein
MKSKQDMIKEMSSIVEQYDLKKQIIIKMLDDLDKKPIGDEHVNGISTVNELMNELMILENKYNELVKKIKE